MNIKIKMNTNIGFFNNQIINNFPIIDNNDFQSNQIKIQFQYIGQNIDIYSNLNETAETIFKKFGEKIHKSVNNMQFLYAGQNLNFKNFLFEVINNYDKERKTMIVIVYDNDIDENLNEDKNKIMANHVVCPICKESARIYFENMTIKIANCKYKLKNKKIYFHLFLFSNNKKKICYII